MFIIRYLIGRLILLVNLLTLPKKPQHEQGVKEQLQQVTGDLSLYQLNACPFCVKVRRQIRRLGLDIELRDIKQSEHYLDELIANGGKRTVPCLRIAKQNGEVEWLYESNDINAYLSEILATAKAPQQA